MEELTIISLELESLIEKIEFYKSSGKVFDSWDVYNHVDMPKNFESKTYGPLFTTYNDIVSRLKGYDKKTFSSLKKLKLSPPLLREDVDNNYNHYDYYLYTSEHLIEILFETKKAKKILDKFLNSKEKISTQQGVEFVAEDSLNSAIIGIIKEARSFITLIAPYIKLHERIKDALLLKLKVPALSLVVVFGKNEQDKSKSLSTSDKTFLNKFPKLSLYYKNRLHAKCYFNEKEVLLTSMNLYDYSQNNNIEFGVLIKKEINPSLYDEVITYFKDVIENSIKQ
ncbi:phospholipase D family protein [Aureispira anguillae]|uniref:Phospholipase D family protein n=1 Tax=Aureispira anguillae TaxID=2864201 RepID=A0A915YE79_9BACT|nr:phospholipase D family protein [Aureispira anguillae]BDS11492.1 phospholipase D family protein [Aureispira anguillae]